MEDLNYDEEKKRYVSFCGSYCRTCDWFTGKIQNTFQSALDMVEQYGFRKWLEGKVDMENFKEGLKILANTQIDSGCKAQVSEKPDRCQIRQCCFQKGYDICSECPDFACDLLKTNPGVLRFHCIENLMKIREKGIKDWIDKQWQAHRTQNIQSSPARASA